jgi:transcriptional regulator with PAS, ATPase and Fis domain
MPHGAVDEALRIVVRMTGALGAAFGEWTPRGELCVIAHAGPFVRISDKRAIARFFAEHRSATAVIDDDLRYACAAHGRRGYDLLALIVWGDATASFDDLMLLRLFLRLNDSHREPRSAWAAQAQPEPFRFPDGYVPGTSASMVETYRQMRLVAPAAFPLLVSGETGVGKEHIVRILHSWSGRRRGPFVAVNCAAIPETLLESELFGIGRGVATGVSERAGRFQEAEGGTLFLDEIGELPPSLQAKLLRVLQDHEVTPVGARPVKVDVRVIAATNAELERKIRDGEFRSDLYYRVAGCVVRVPPLRERPEDVSVLIEHFLHTFSAEAGYALRGVSASAMELLTAYEWPGNVRELEHELRRLVYTCPPGQMIEASALSVTPGAQPLRVSATLDLATRVAELERALIHEALQRSRGNRSVAARLLGVSRNGLALKMQRLDSSETTL